MEWPHPVKPPAHIQSPGLKLEAYSLNAQFISSNFITEDPPAFRIKNFQPISNAGK
jgi:hypothetical protein